MPSNGADIMPTWLNNDFVKRMLKKSDNYKGFSVALVEVTQATAQGDNYLSEVYRMRVELKHNVKHLEKTLSFVIKKFPEEKAMQQFAQEVKAFERETSMFTKTIPAMTQLLRRSASNKFTQLSAQCFDSGKEPVDYIVLEDLNASGFIMAKRHRGLDLEHSKTVVRKLAEFHAASFGVYENDPAAMDAYTTSEWFHGGATTTVLNCVKQACFLLADELETQETFYARYAPKLRALPEKLFLGLAELTKPVKGKFRVLAHADTWINNLMFKYSNGVLKDVVLVDFQLSTYSSPSIDLYYFTHTSLTEEVYDNHLNDLLKEYHHHLIEIMSDIGISTDKQISYEDFMEDFEDYALYGMFAVVAISPLVHCDETTGHDMEAAMHVSDSSTNRKSFASASLLKFVKKLLPEYEKKGLL